MDSIRCRCGKIVCQVANIPDQNTWVRGEALSRQSPALVILCRHCKARVVLQVSAVLGIDVQSGPQRLGEVHFFENTL